MGQALKLYGLLMHSSSSITEHIIESLDTSVYKPAVACYISILDVSGYDVIVKVVKLYNDWYIRLEDVQTVTINTFGKL